MAIMWEVSDEGECWAKEVGVVWNVVATKPAEELRAAAHLSNQGFDIFLPRVRKTVRHARRVTNRLVPLFPGYLFVAADPAARWRAVNGTVGVRHIVTAGERPARVEPGFVEALQEGARADGTVDLSPILEVGDRVEVATGPMAGRIGQLVGLDAQGRVAVLMTLLSGHTRVRTTLDSLLPG